MSTVKRALISVSDKRGVVQFAQRLERLGVEIVSTGGTARTLSEAGVRVRSISDLTGFPEMMDGRVKTLHPKVHGGLLALRDHPDHMKDVSDHAIELIDLVVVNLYPFEQTIAKPDVPLEEAIENIDIGGPTMLRSAAKNYRHVAVVTDPSDYDRVAEELESSGAVSAEMRAALCVKVFRSTADYDAAIDRYLSKHLSGEQILRLSYKGGETLRYGENSHQEATFYRDEKSTESSLARATILNGKEMSYNNYVDADAALEAAKSLRDTCGVAVIKHTNPCGYATGSTLREAMEAAWAGDPISAFGSVIAVTCPVDMATAEFLKGDSVPHISYEIINGENVPSPAEGKFVEVLIAPRFDADALAFLQKKSKMIRLLQVDPFDAGTPDPYTYRKITGGMLEQGRDLSLFDKFETMTEKAFPEAKSALAEFSWKACKYTKSNAIILCREYRPGQFQVIGMGAGQPNRVDSLRKLAATKARENLKIEWDASGRTGDFEAFVSAQMAEMVMASDALFPFSDTVEESARVGVRYIVQPGGANKDQASIDACNRVGVAMVFTGMRHFLH
ncbi:MAG: bifunctional phosphoribosylaminoimidazolecarboxamide formyltransferase/IMP cyclohydrolase [Candidatus Latescibacterota bacterium]